MNFYFKQGAEIEKLKLETEFEKQNYRSSYLTRQIKGT